MKRYLMSLIVLVLLAGTSCQEKIDTEADIEAIKNVIEEYDVAVNAGDVDGLVSLYADDAVRMPPNNPASVGKEAIHDWFQAVFEQYYATELDQTCEEVLVCGDWAFVWGTYTVTLTPKVGGEPIRHAGEWMEFHKRQPADSWSIYRHIYNSGLTPSDVQ